MKRTPFQGPLWWRLALLHSFLLGTNNILLSDNQCVKALFVENQYISTIVYTWPMRSCNIDEAQDEFVNFSSALAENNTTIRNDIFAINSLNWSFLKLIQADLSSTFTEKCNLNLDSVVFDFATSGKSSKSYQCILRIDSSFSSSFMPCCDQLYIGGKIDPQVSMKKNKTSMCVANFPKSSFYEIFAVGQGIITAQGSPGYFFVPPNVHFGHLPLQLIGPGPHKIYWLDADHIDEIGHLEEERDSISLFMSETRDPYFQNGTGSTYDLLGRTSSENGTMKVMRIDGKWVKVVTVK